MISDIRKGDWLYDTSTAHEFGSLFLHIPGALEHCDMSMDEDIDAIDKWAQIFTHPQDLSTTIRENYVVNKSEIQTDLNNLGADWDKSDYNGAG